MKTVQELLLLPRYRDLILQLVWNDLASRYRRSLVGVFWSILQPTARLLVILVAFNYLLGSRTPDYSIYVFSGLVFWNFFGQSVIGGMNSLRSNAGVLLQLPVPMVIFPLSACLSGIINLLIMFIPMTLILLLLGRGLDPALAFLPIPVLIATMFTFGVGLFLGPLAVRFQDIIYLTEVSLQLLFYLVPIMYPIIIIPEDWRWIVQYNPIRSVLEVFRDPIYYGKIPPLTHLAMATAVAVAMMTIGVITMEVTRRRLAYYI